MSNEPSTAVAVCGRVSWLANITLSPIRTRTVAGVNTVPGIITSAVAPAAAGTPTARAASASATSR